MFNRMKSAPADASSPSPAEVLASAETRRTMFTARLDVARTELAELRGAIDKERESYLAAAAQAELTGGAAPSRSALTARQAELPEAEDRVAALERALAEVDREWRLARAGTLAAEAAEIRAETEQRQARVHELQAEIDVRQREVNEHTTWIGNFGPGRASQRDAEARQLQRS